MLRANYEMDQPVSSLDLPMYTISKLENLGFHYCSDLKNDFEANNLKTTVPNISEVMKAPKAKTALEIYKNEVEFESVKSFIPELDSFLESEVIPGSITELCGFPGTGKTQICLHLAVGASGEVVYIHSNKSLNPERLEEIAKKFDVDATNTEKILCIEVEDSVELMASFHFLETWLPDHKNIRLLIIDSITWPLKQQPPTERGPFICSLFQNLRILANSYNFPIVITNSLTTRVIDGKIFNTSAFGDSFYHLVNNRILLSKEDKLFTAKILKTVTGSSNATSFRL